MLSFCVVAALLSTALAVKPIHSHNDYTRAVPLWDALNLSIMSVEADVWWVQSDNELYVAHTSGEINKSITLGGLYINPILGIINGTVSSMTPISVSNPLQLLIDFKSDGPSTYAPVLAALQPLRAAGHLTTYANGVLTQGAVTAVGTGNTPLASVVAASPRDLFFDADILQLYSTKPGTGLEWGPEIAPLASVDYSSVSSTAEMQALVLNAHDFGIRSRFWDTAASVSTWDTFWSAGSDWVNADDLQAVSDAWAAFQASVQRGVAVEVDQEVMTGEGEEEALEAAAVLQTGEKQWAVEVGFA